MKVLTVFGTRPEAIKMAPVIHELQRFSDQIDSKVCVTAQHRDMLDQVLELFDIVPDFDLDVMDYGQTPAQVIRLILERLEPVLHDEKPDWVLVQGDTTTVMVAALLAFLNRIRIGHVEAGLRTGDKYQPFPEEINRKIVDTMADLYFAPTETSRQHLLHEAIDDTHILVTGNTVIDALIDVSNRSYDWNVGPLASLPPGRRYVLVTAHRRENFGKPLRNICAALSKLAADFSDDIHLVYPVHPNPNVHDTVQRLLSGIPNITLLPPLDYLCFVQLLKRSVLVLTDSGGLQEEAPALGIPVLVMRATTERPEAIEAGTACLVGTDRDNIVRAASSLLSDPDKHGQMAKAANPFGDGHAAEKIVRALLNFDCH